MRKFTSYSPVGSDDGYDYQKDNRYGEVDDYVKFVEKWRKDQAKKKAESPNNGGWQSEKLWYNARKKERELKMRMIEIITSDCCGDEVRGLDFCACCLEHCTPIVEYIPDPATTPQE